MSIVLNVLALLLVIGISWVGMMWLAGRVHGRDGGDATLEQLGGHGEAGEACPACDGVGAQQRLGALQPCLMCEGTGEVTALPG